MMARNRTQAAVLIVLGLLMSQTLAAEAAPRAFPGRSGSSICNRLDRRGGHPSHNAGRCWRRLSASLCGKGRNASDLRLSGERNDHARHPSFFAQTSTSQVRRHPGRESRSDWASPAPRPSSSRMPAMSSSGFSRYARDRASNLRHRSMR